MKYLSFTNLITGFWVALMCSQAVLAQSKQPLSAPDEFRILHHERLRVSLSEQLATRQRSPGLGKAAKINHLSFTAYGQAFDIELQPNNKLMSNLPKAQKARLKQSMRIYRGRITGIHGSWARITKIGKRLSGAVWDGNELYLIDTSDHVGQAIDKTMTKQAAKKPYTLIYRASDIVTNASCDSDAKGKPFSFRGLVKELKEKAQVLPKAASRQLDVAIIADAQFTSANSANPQAAVVARMNVVDGIFSDQIGVHISLNEIRALTNNDLMTSTNAGDLLGELGAYTAPSRFNNPGIAHLLTGRDLEGSTVGIAYIGVLCDKIAGIGLSEHRGTGTAGALTAAHEIGHNFGAPHDNDGSSACASTPGSYLMNPVLNGSAQFSPCSIQQIKPVISGATCLTAYKSSVSSVDVRPVIPVNPISANIGSAFKFAVEVKNSGGTAAQNTTAKLNIPAALTVATVTASSGQCTHSGGAVSCTLGNLASNATSTITVSVKAGSTAANLSGSVQVAADNDGDTSNNSAAVAINVVNTTTTPIFAFDFNANTGGFVYNDDTFNSQQPAYANGSWVSDAGNGQLMVVLGGINDDDITNGMSGGWRKSFTLSEARAVKLSFTYQLFQASAYEPDEYSDALLAVDGRIIGVNGGSFLSRLAGDGELGIENDKTTGRVPITVSVGTLAAGNHTIMLGAFNNKKTFRDEVTTVYFDNIKAEY